MATQTEGATYEVVVLQSDGMTPETEIAAMVW